MTLEQLILGHEHVLLDRNSTRAIISDALSNDLPKVNALMSAYDAGIVKLIEENFPVSFILKNNFVNKLINQYSMQEKVAAWAVEKWVSVLSPKVLEEYIKIKNEKEAEKQEIINKYISSENDDPIKTHTQSESNSDELTIKNEIVDFYTNVKLNKIKNKIFIPCGVGTTDNGFYICGIEEQDVSSAPVVFALVYNYLMRNSTIMPEDYPTILKNKKVTYQVNYQRVYRLMVIILQLIKNAYTKNKLDISYDGNFEEIKLSVEIINNYVGLFSRLIGIKPIVLEVVSPSMKSIKISLDKKINGIYIEDNYEPSNARELWYSQKINYNLTKDNIKDLEFILSEISPFKTFKEGQFVALTSMLNTQNHSMCIMPTGSGKSLIFYLASLLQPLPMMVLAPTEILIEDQIRNLKKFHHMDNVSHLKLTSDNDFRDFRPSTSLMYLTPMTFQSRNLIAQCRHINDGKLLLYNPDTKLANEKKVSPGPSLGYVVLDEIHCLSNWGHDFRPEYLMLSKFLNKFLSRVSFLGFTATANYTVVEDIQKQLSIPQENIFSPINFEKYNISYNFTSVDSEDEMYIKTCEIVQNLIRRNERTLIFTKNEEISCKLADRIGFEADVFQNDNTNAYQMFAEEKCGVLVASEDLGIGINLPNIQNVIHFGLPVSKNEYVQEIGRAGRADESVTSYIIYLEMHEGNVPQVLLQRELEVHNVSEVLDNINNDYSNCYRKLNNNIDSKEDLLDQLMSFYQEFESEGKGLYVKTYDLVEAERAKKYIYMLYVLGYVFDWYAYSGNEKDGTIDILIDISSSNHSHFLIKQNMLTRVQARAVTYYDSLGTNREQIVKTQRAKTVEEIISVYIDWYYSKFLYHHKELFLDFLDFVSSNTECDSEKITEDIQEYFTLPFVEIKNDELYYTNLSLEEIGNKIAQGFSRKTLANIERINSNRYSFNLDCLIFLGSIRLNSRFDGNRLNRILNTASIEQRNIFKEALLKLYDKLPVSERLNFVFDITQYPILFGKTVEDVCSVVYSKCQKDVIFYGLMSQRLNKLY